jgi:excinuclease ABC subunit A
MDFMADLRLRCDRCDGKRFDPATLAPRYRGHSVVDVLELTVDEAHRLFRDVPRVARPLGWMQDVGLGYLVLGQPAPTLSGGEAQRLKLVRELARGAEASLYVLDEPTVGLHAAEVSRLVGILRRLTAAGNGVVVVEHHLDVLAACDWLVELGPDGGNAGGRLVAEGPPEVVARAAGSGIARYLAPRLEGGRRSVGDPVPA